MSRAQEPTDSTFIMDEGPVAQLPLGIELLGFLALVAGVLVAIAEAVTLVFPSAGLSLTVVGLLAYFGGRAVRLLADIRNRLG